MDELLVQTYLEELILQRLSERPGDVSFINNDFNNNDVARCRT